jgi:predicted RNA-binding Zn-ribbon protein involved in translation (DUF1610 family)
MAETDGASSPREASVEATSRDVEEGRVLLESDVAIHRCSSCNAELGDRYHFDCPECGHASRPVSCCRSCKGPLKSELIRYVAEGPGGGSVLKLLPGVSCATCAVTAVEEQELDALDALAAYSSVPVELLPESGISTRERLEVLADADVCGPGEPLEIVKRRDGMTLRIGSPTPLFEAALAVVTEHDPADIFSPTLSFEPGPPYAAAQRRIFHLLLSDLQRELGAPVSCWSASVGLSEEPLVDPVLTEQLMSWSGDPDGSALALYHAITGGQAPGRFVNSVRLLARVLDLRAGQELGQVLRDRLERLEPPPLEILQQLWLAMHPGRSFDERQVFASMEAFHARYSAVPDSRGGPRLPWEDPDFDGYAVWLRRLVSALLASAPG